ncbi:TetR/AcrR family transcriptional regulator C-terminal domain-containing protein [Nonomuraea sp. NPDC050783]|uniref:TetR/AcrR family transcriptional regulator C-terminal domain-containing protein n=1 Tax=Nonomuraea sp. NPDC050783 TaxID=3154634 RepID=UPI003465858B
MHPEGPWPAWARDFAVSFRSALLAHPALLPLLATRPVTTPGGLRTVERAARALTDEGFTPTEALHVITTIGTFAIGQVLAEAGSTPGHSAPAGPAGETRVAGRGQQAPCAAAKAG